MDIDGILNELSGLLHDIEPRAQRTARRRLLLLLRTTRFLVADRERGADLVNEAMLAIRDLLGPSPLKLKDAEIEILSARIIESDEIRVAVAGLRRLRADVTRSPRRGVARTAWDDHVAQVLRKPEVRAHLGAKGTKDERTELRKLRTTGPAYAARAILAALVGAPASWLRDLGASSSKALGGSRRKSARPARNAGGDPSGTR